MPLVRSADLEPVPWRNGLGITRNVLVAPGGADEWSLSVSDLERDVQFSDFSGMDRIFTIIEGEGVELVIDGETVAVVAFQPLRFRGESAPALHLPFGACRAFNVILDRSKAQGEVVVRRLEAGTSAFFAEGTVLVYCVHGVVEVGSDTVGSGDSLIGGGEVRAAVASTLVQVVISPRTKAPSASGERAVPQ